MNHNPHVIYVNQLCPRLPNDKDPHMNTFKSVKQPSLLTREPCLPLAQHTRCHDNCHTNGIHCIIQIKPNHLPTST